MSNKYDVQEKILEFIKNRSGINETTATRHIHRRFGMPEEEVEKIVNELFDENKIKKIYDEEYQEKRFKIAF
ncbi:MAG: hypothetical protein EA447_06355 [Nitrosopumilus sp.]|nr:MAG: hypothetical protein EA447_06355 [Nitrosopumilus sp.]